MENLFIFLVSFGFIFATYLAVYILKRLRKEVKNMKEFDLLKYKFKITTMNYNLVGLIIVFINSLIIAIAGTVCTMFKIHFILQLLLGFVLLLILITFFYGLLGKILKLIQRKKKEERY